MPITPSKNSCKSHRFADCPQMGVVRLPDSELQGQAMKLTGSYLAIVMRQALIARP